MNSFDDDGPKQSSSQLNGKYPYSPSIASAASSSSSSVFSVDGKSSQSSAPSSVKSGSPAWDSDGAFQSIAHNGSSNFSVNSSNAFIAPQPIRIPQQSAVHVQQILHSNGTVAPELRCNPRRTQPSAQADRRDTRAPPSLVRQCDRKDNFVESLVDTTSQMIEVIWPTSVTSCPERDHAVLGGKNLIGLRTFIQEVLKRSKTSYSTLQVALYYLVLIKPCIPNVDFTQEQIEDSHASRAMQCGRRMFLAALILASKYLQDRNYSARAWSKISGLKVQEINQNERAFVAAVNWNLHVPEQRFQRWTDVVLKYSLSHSSTSGGREAAAKIWQSIVPKLTPELTDLEVPDLAKPGNMSIPIIPKCPLFSTTMCPPPSLKRIDEIALSSGESTPTPATTKPEALEPTPRASKENFRFPPISPRITQLPTPVMTPRPNGFVTPAASFGSYCRGQSMSDAMKQIQRSSMERCTVDTWPYPTPAGEGFPKRFPLPSRRPSYAFSSSSTISSPESMISDFSSSQGSSYSSRTSRSSSVCSVTSSAGALPQPTRLAVQATRRCATMAAVKEQPSGGYLAEANFFPGFAHESYMRSLTNPDNSETTAALALSDLASGKGTPSPRSTTSQRKRERPSSIVDSYLDAEVRLALLNNPETSSVDNQNVVTEDNRPATSFLLHDEDRRLPFERVSTSCIRSASGSRDGARKRTCKDEAWANAGMLTSAFCV